MCMRTKTRILVDIKLRLQYFSSSSVFNFFFFLIVSGYLEGITSKNASCKAIFVCRNFFIVSKGDYSVLASCEDL